MASFTPDQWLILLLAFVLGLILGMALLASPKWKGRYRDEVRRREELEAENRQLRKDAGEMDSLRQAAARDEARHRDEPRLREDETRLREEARLREDETRLRDEARLRDDEARRRDTAELESLREAAARDEPRRRGDEPGPL